MLNYILALAVTAMAVTAMVTAGPTAETALLLSFTMSGVVALMPFIQDHRETFRAIFQALCAGLLIFGWFLVMSSPDGMLSGDDRSLAITFVTVGAFTLAALGLGRPLRRIAEHRPTNSRSSATSPASAENFDVDPNVLFSKLDAVLTDSAPPDYMELGRSGVRPPPVASTGAVSDDDPTTHFSQDELSQIKKYSTKLHAKAKDEDPTTLFSKNELAEIREYAERLHSEKAARTLAAGGDGTPES